jgi:DNA-binding transcriptional LysR family regulator
MDLISGLQTFIRVIETGSFSAVARESSTSQSAVTRHVAQLEEHFGVRLFHRTTRKISLTDDGQDLVTRARHLLELATDLEDNVGRARGAPTGLVRIGLPVGAAMLLVPDFTALLREYPGLSIELAVEERFDDLVAQRLDIALRFGQATDNSSVISRVLATVGSAPVAAPAYLERHGAPSHPSELAQHTCIVNEWPESTHWVFTGPSGPVDVEVSGALRCNNTLVTRQAALSGYGIALLPDPMTINDIRSSRLYRLLPDYTIRRRPAFIVYPSRRHLPPRTRVVIDFLVDRFKELDARLRNGREWGENEATWLV